VWWWGKFFEEAGGNLTIVVKRERVFVDVTRVFFGLIALMNELSCSCEGPGVECEWRV
jgi:hypothetical protein